MSDALLLDIRITRPPPAAGGADHVLLTVTDPATGLAPLDSQGSLALPPALPDGAASPSEHGRALREALLATPAVRDRFVEALAKSLGARPPRPLRLRLRLPADAADLHRLRWETLLSPLGGEEPLLCQGDVTFSRFIEGDARSQTPLKGRARALVAIASPTWIKQGWDQRPVPVQAELQRARLSLGGLVAHELYRADEQPDRVSLAALLEALGQGEPYHILYLVCHGAIIEREGQPTPMLWLEEGDGRPLPAARLADGLRGLGQERWPRLVVLASCQSAGQDTQVAGARESGDKGALAAAGPLLMQAGVPAVVAMQGNVLMTTVEALIPVFFQELVRGGNIERAMAAARGRVRSAPPSESVRDQWHVPVLYSQLDDGRLWTEAEGVGALLQQLQSLKPRIFVSHAAAGTADADQLAALIALLEARGYHVLVDRENARSALPWNEKLFQELGNCDGAVILLNDQALSAAGSWVQDEARLLCWRNTIEPDFSLVTVCLSQGVATQLQGQPWAALMLGNVVTLDGGSVEERMARLDPALGSLQQTSYRGSWRLLDLEQQVAHVLAAVEPERLGEALRDLARDQVVSQPTPAEEQLSLAQWWARMLLRRGLGLLPPLVAKLDTGLAPAARKELLALLGSSWVDIRAAGLIPAITRSQAQAQRSFYLGLSTEQAQGRARARVPLPWLARSYLQRACCRGPDMGPCWSLVMVTPKGEDKLDNTRAELRRELFRDELAQGDLFEEDLDDERIKEEVERRDALSRPVVLVLPEQWLQDPPLLDEIRVAFGPLTFFVLATNPAVAAQAGLFRLEPVADQADCRAYEDYRRV